MQSTRLYGLRDLQKVPCFTNGGNQENRSSRDNFKRFSQRLGNMRIEARQEDFEKLEYESMDEVKAYDQTVRHLNSFLHRPVLKEILRFKKSGWILDAGCGQGGVLVKVSLRNAQIRGIGIDISLNMLEIARKNIAQKEINEKIKLVCGNLKALPFRNNSFDAIVCTNVLHHIENKIEAINEMAGVLKPHKSIMVIYDLFHIPGVWQKFFVGIMLTYTQEMKRQYRDSLACALQYEQWQDVVESSLLKGAEIRKLWPHFLMIVKKFD